jgi:two-component system response regulator PilR (NtrC family)
MPNHLALVVDDEPDIRELLELTLGRMNIDTLSASDLQEARALLGKRDFDLCLTDMRLPDGDGIELVQEIQEQHPDLPVAVITAHGSMDTAVQALKAGAFDFVSKPVDLQVLRNLVNSALKLSDRYPQTDRRSRDTLLGESAAMRRIRSTIAKLARSQAPVYISGESGTGKELVARLIHSKGPRGDRPFVPVNCGAIPADLMESEFFGHKKGSFTGAVADKLGLFQAADGGTLFLDEVADLPLHMQVKLLRAIQEKAVRPVGSQKEVAVDVRILSATHKDLGQLVEDGHFRQDLYYRINVIELKVPTLQERRDDIPQLAGHILEKLAAEFQIPTPRLSEAAVEQLKAYGFPGNVRELENILERAMTLCEGDTIEADDLHLREEGFEELPTEEGVGLEADLEAVDRPEDVPLEDYLGEVEKKAILDALEKTRYNKTQAAKLLGITFRALRYRLKKLGLE